jgi:hypothetical protein
MIINLAESDYFLLNKEFIFVSTFFYESFIIT